MADSDNQNTDPNQQPQVVIVQDPVIAAQQAIAAAAREAELKHLDETQPGGRYKVNGVYVDAEGKPHKNQKDA